MPEEQKSSEGATKSPLEREFVDFPFPTVYTNAMNVGSSFFEFSLLVMDQLDVGNVSIRSRIVMAPAHAKLLFVALGKQLQNYEGKFGEIRIPAAVQTATTASSETAQQP